MKELVAVYYSNSIFEIDFDINRVHKWFIKRDVLYVIHNDGDDFSKYYPDVSALDDHDCIKYPTEIYVDGGLLNVA